jgi:uncharacterized protein (DUF1501 family)
MKNHEHKTPDGSKLQDGQAHEHHHSREIGRRDFLKNLGLVTAGSFALSGLPFQQLFAAPAVQKMLVSSQDRILVVIRLKGGNDGLNTIVPLFDYGTYATFRPSLKIPTADLLPLNNQYAVPQFASALKSMWDSGKMRVVHNVGYDDMDLSHFVSTDIWDSADNSNSPSKSGWLGRYLWDHNPNFITNPPANPLAIQIGGDGNILFFNQDNLNMAMNVVDPQSLYQIAQTGSLYTVGGNAPCYYEDQLDFMKSMINSTYYQSETIHDAYNAGSNDITYPAYDLANALSLVSRLIKGGLQTRIFMLTLDGFDTHAQQDVRHPELMAELANSVKAFYDDLQVGGKDSKVLCMTFSEFGRRVFDNGSMGTDHGTAAPLLLFGTPLAGNGFIGDDVNLSDLDSDFNLKHKIDFRQVYSTVLQDWLCAEEITADTILGGSYAKLGLGFNCVTGVNEPSIPNAYHQLRYQQDGTAFLFLNLPESAPIKLEVFDFTGRKIMHSPVDYFSKGLHSLPIPGFNQWPKGAYLYNLYINGKIENGKIHR